jgi:hypothetical protein
MVSGSKEGKHAKHEQNRPSTLETFFFCSLYFLFLESKILTLGTYNSTNITTTPKLLTTNHSHSYIMIVYKV